MNALLGPAYTTGLQLEASLDGAPMRKQGTWIRALGLAIHDQRLLISSTDEAMPELETALSWAPECSSPAASGSLELGLVFVDFRQLCRIGTYQLDHQIRMELRNSKSFSRVELTSPSVEIKVPCDSRNKQNILPQLSSRFGCGQVDIVSPPASWGLGASSLTDDLFHLNFAIDKMVIDQDETPSGVLGKTASDWTPAHRMQEEDYVVSQLIA